MTQNQIAYQTLLETKRRNAADEALRAIENDIKQQRADTEKWKTGYTIADSVSKGLTGLFTGLAGKEFTGGSGIGQLGSAIGSGLSSLWSGGNYYPIGALGAGAGGITLGLDIFEDIAELIDGKTEYVFTDKSTGKTETYFYDRWNRTWIDSEGHTVPDPFTAQRPNSDYEVWIEGIGPDWAKPGQQSQHASTRQPLINIFDVAAAATEDIFV